MVVEMILIGSLQCCRSESFGEGLLPDCCCPLCSPVGIQDFLVLDCLISRSGWLANLSMCLGLAGIGALVFTKPCSSTHWSCFSFGFKPPENDFPRPLPPWHPRPQPGRLGLGLSPSSFLGGTSDFIWRALSLLKSGRVGTCVTFTTLL